MSDEWIFFKCKLCGKNLIQRNQHDGYWYFRFGKRKEHLVRFSVVDMIIHGSIKMKCLRATCREQNPDHWNILNFLPLGNDFNSVKSL